jgi:hypothetical protein
VSEISLENCVEMPRATGSRRTSRFRANSLPTVEEIPIELNLTMISKSLFNYRDSVSSEKCLYQDNKRNSIAQHEGYIRPDCNRKQSDLNLKEDVDKICTISSSNTRWGSVKDLSNVNLTSLSNEPIQQSGVNRLSVDCGISMDSSKIPNINTHRRVSFEETVNNCSKNFNQMKPDIKTSTDNGSVRRITYENIPNNNVNDELHLNRSAFEHLYKIFNFDAATSCKTEHERHPVERLSHSYRRRHKTTIMLILTSVFVISMALYVILTSFVAKPNSILLDLSNTQKAVFFFFWRLYFMNSVVNPFLYGFMDPRFRKGLYALHICKHNHQTVPISINTNATSVKDNHQSYSVFSAE